jgi:hypothetical protein
MIYSQKYCSLLRVFSEGFPTVRAKQSGNWQMLSEKALLTLELYLENMRRT